LFDSRREFEGLIATMHRTPIHDQERLLTILDVASATIASELEREANERRITELVDTDHLTGFSSKVALNRHLRRPGAKSILIASLDTLSIINQAYGFAEGDAVIARTAAMLRDTFEADFYGALGPTKFVLVYDGQRELRTIAEEISDHFAANTVQTDSLAVYVSFSFGAAQGDDEVLRLATKELQRAKATGSSKLAHIATEHDKAETFSEQRLIAASTLIHQALAHGSVSPRFQRIVSLEDGSTHKVEALARIIADGEVLTPGRFLQAAKASGNMPALTRKMVDKTFTVMANYDLPFSINVSEFDLEDGDLLDFLLGEAEQHGIDPGRVTLELLETISSSAKSAHIQQLRDFKAAGFKLAIDDFGAEYSSFARILELDVDYLKIDARFVTRVHDDRRCAEIIKAIVYFCQNAGIKSIAEHVDREEIAAKLREIGVDYAQGFLFARPQEAPI
jgi:diguanylate cyclase (GGDEF)-like protein